MDFSGKFYSGYACNIETIKKDYLQDAKNSLNKIKPKLKI